MALSLLPSVIDSLRVSAGLLIVFWASGFVSGLIRQRRAARESMSSVFGAILGIGNLVGYSLGLLVVLGIHPEHAARLYTSAMLCLLLTASLLLWRTVRNLVLSPELSASA